MPVEAVMSRISEIRSMVGFEPAAVKTEPSVASAVSVSASADAGAGATDLASTFSEQLSTALSSGDSSKISSVINTYTSAGSTGSSASSVSAPAATPLVQPAAPSAREAVEVPKVAQAPKVTKVEAAAPAEVRSSDSENTTGSAVVSEAKKYLGIPYVWGGTNPAKGLDCSGLVQLVFKNLGYDLPRVARQQAKVGTEVSSMAKAQPGDVLGMRNGSHIAIYLGDNKILHAPQPGEKVSIRSLTKYDDIDTIRRIAKPSSTASLSSATGIDGPGSPSAALAQYTQSLSALNSSTSRLVSS